MASHNERKFSYPEMQGVRMKCHNSVYLWYLTCYIYLAHAFSQINFYLQCGMDLVNDEARGTKQGSLSKEGTPQRKKRESRVQSFGWNQVQCTRTLGTSAVNLNLFSPL